MSSTTTPEPPRKRYRRNVIPEIEPSRLNLQPVIPGQYGTIHSAVRSMKVSITPLSENSVSDLNISSWFLSIGTHTKIYSNRDFEIYKQSMIRAFNNAFESPKNNRELSHAFFVVNAKKGEKVSITKINEGMAENEGAKINNPHIIREVTGEYVVEQGGKNHMVNAHITMRVKHHGKIMLDHVRLAAHIQKYLVLENNAFENASMYYKDKNNETIRWKGIEGNQKIYLSFRNLGKINSQAIWEYMTKEMIEGADFKDSKAPLTLATKSMKRTQKMKYEPGKEPTPVGKPNYEDFRVVQEIGRSGYQTLAISNHLPRQPLSKE